MMSWWQAGLVRPPPRWPARHVWRRGVMDKKLIKSAGHPFFRRRGASISQVGTGAADSEPTSLVFPSFVVLVCLLVRDPATSPDRDLSGAFSVHHRWISKTTTPSCFLHTTHHRPDPKLLHRRAGTKAGPWFFAHPSPEVSVRAVLDRARAALQPSAFECSFPSAEHRGHGGLNSVKCRCRTQASIDIPTSGSKREATKTTTNTVWQTGPHGDD